MQKFRDACGALGSWGPFNPVAHPAVGNHEYEEPGAAGYFDYFAENGVNTGARHKGYYSYTVGAWHLVALDSNCSEVTGGCGGTSPQMTWLKNDLATDRSTCEIAYWHHPRFSSRTTNKTMGAAWTKLYAARVDIVLNGHQHNYERFALQKGRGLLTPCAGFVSLSSAAGAGT